MHLKLLIKDGSLREALEEIELPATVGSEYLSKLREKSRAGSGERQNQSPAPFPFKSHKILFSSRPGSVFCARKSRFPAGMLIDSRAPHLIDHKKVQKYQNRYQMATRQPCPGIEGGDERPPCAADSFNLSVRDLLRPGTRL